MKKKQNLNKTFDLNILINDGINKDSYLTIN